MRHLRTSIAHTSITRRARRRPRATGVAGSRTPWRAATGRSRASAQGSWRTDAPRRAPSGTSPSARRTAATASGSRCALGRLQESLTESFCHMTLITH